MYLHAIARAVPEASYTQPDCWDLIRNSGTLERLRPRSAQILEKVLLGDSGIETRHFANPQIEKVFSLDASALHHEFERAAPALGTDALEKALEQAGLDTEALDALFICTCTGYMCPGLSSYVSEQLHMKPDSYLQDIVGLGCGAAIPTLRSAQGFLAANPKATAACIAVEVCSAAFYLDDDPGVLISACLFGDGASASIWSGKGTPSKYHIRNFDTIHQPENRELLRFTNVGGKLRNQLHRSVPEVAAPMVRTLFARSGLDASARVAAHTGGRDVLDQLESGLAAGPLVSARNTLRRYGNISSPSCLFALEDLLQSEAPPESIWLTSFGAGFAAHSCTLSTQPV